MKHTAVALWTLLGVAFSSAAAFAVPVSSADRPSADPIQTITAPQGNDMSQFSAGRTLVLDARVGHKALPPAGGETFVFASVGGRDEGRSVAAPLNLGIVIDKSGSMKGQRITNALAAAMGTVDRMRDGDMVSVVSFDNNAQVVVPPTRVSQDSRSGIISAIQSIRLGGDTCISCGLETAMQELQRANDGRAITRMLLLSDGAANQGVRDVSGLRAIAGRMRDRGCTISTIGVDVDFDEKIMSAIATESNGRHYFVANSSELQNVFQQEFESLVATVARDAELEIELAPGVEAVQVFDRTHRRNGQRITVPFGTLSARQEKTVLLKVKVPESLARGDGTQPVAQLRLVYQDASHFSREQVDGSLAVKTSSRASLDDLDPFVAARLSRSLTADALTEANSLFEQGRVDEARRRLTSQAGDLAKIETKAKAAASAAPAPKTASRGLTDDFEQQLDAVRSAESSFGAAAAGPGGGAAAPAKREGKAQVRENAANAQSLGF
jgi:Ca-activated chloride channel family protein